MPFCSLLLTPEDSSKCDPNRLGRNISHSRHASNREEEDIMGQHENVAASICAEWLTLGSLSRFRVLHHRSDSVLNSALVAHDNTQIIFKPQLQESS